MVFTEKISEHGVTVSCHHSVPRHIPPPNTQSQSDTFVIFTTFSYGIDSRCFPVLVWLFGLLWRFAEPDGGGTLSDPQDLGEEALELKLN